MATITLDLSAVANLGQAAAERGLRTAAAQGAAILQADILNRPGSGRIYGKHQASAPGEPPAPDTGRLRGATMADPDVRQDGPDLVSRVVENTEYAHALNVGTERMAARPSLNLLVTDHAGELKQAFVLGAKGA